MANQVLWDATWSSRGTVLTTELNSLANGAYSAVGTAYDNTANLNRWGVLEMNLASLNPTTGAYLMLFMVQSADGTNYEDAPASTNPGMQMLVAVLNLATGSATKRVISRPFRLPAGKVKFVLLNGSNVSLAASGSTVTLYTADDEVQ